MAVFKRKSGYIIRSYEQLVDWMNGISKHNYIDDECCPDFTCCANILPDDKNAKQIVYEYFMEQHFDEIREYKIKKILNK
jgi:hypothetical protein